MSIGLLLVIRVSIMGVISFSIMSCILISSHLLFLKKLPRIIYQYMVPIFSHGIRAQIGYIQLGDDVIICPWPRIFSCVVQHCLLRSRSRILLCLHPTCNHPFSSSALLSFNQEWQWQQIKIKKGDLPRHASIRASYGRGSFGFGVGMDAQALTQAGFKARLGSIWICLTIHPIIYFIYILYSFYVISFQQI